MRIESSRCILVEVLAVTCLIFLSVDQAMSRQDQRKSHREISFSKLEKQFALEEGRALTVVANDLGATGVICIQRFANLGSVQMKACVVTCYDNQNAKSKIPRIEKVLPLPAESVAYNAGTLTINGHGTPQRRFVIHLGVQSGTEVNLFANGQIVGSGITSNVVAQNGKLLTDLDNYSFQAAVMHTISLKDPTK